MAHPKLRQAVGSKVMNVRIPQTGKNFLASWLSNPEDEICPMKLMLNRCNEAGMGSFEKFRLMATVNNITTFGHLDLC